MKSTTFLRDRDNRDLPDMERYYVAVIEAKDRRIDELEMKMAQLELENDFLCRAINEKRSFDYEC